MTVANGVSVTETPRLKRGFVTYASAPLEGPSWAPVGVEGRSGWEPPSGVELRPLPLLEGHGGAVKQEATSLRRGIAHTDKRPEKR